MPWLGTRTRHATSKKRPVRGPLVIKQRIREASALVLDVCLLGPVLPQSERVFDGPGWS
jgi:hypothetical protein